MNPFLATRTLSGRGARLGVLSLAMGLSISPAALAKKSSRTRGESAIKTKIHNLRQKKKEGHQEATEARKKLKVLKKQERTITSQVAETQQCLEQTRGEYDRANHRLNRTRNQLDRTQESLREVEKRLANHNEALGDRLVSIYKNGSLVYLEMVLESRSFSDVVKRTYLFRKIVENDIGLLHRIQADREEIAQKRDLLRHQERQIESAQAQVEQKKKEIATQAERERQLLFKVCHERAAYEANLRELEQSSREITAMIQRLAAPSSGGGVTAWRGGFIRPVSGRITSSFGYRFHPIFKVRRIHTGVDLSARSGTPIRAAAGGRCIFAGWQRAYGKMVIIDHGGGLATVYAHCSSTSISSGSRVSQGQSIAHVGSTGASTGPHLHFEVRRNGRPVNPMTLR
ncbi:MAG: hypothetical protein AUJ92_04895 [Armatimonadetes bacterium CG2_30_59_28]|nr:peptidoglycan DD-metalloendopeptidase family protein [Armatimonadota bacterium]OIO96896.1 MAG: hypothetical protein AUJ92_04895 [Armatimonadetes bacterium CG2_30_59_28]PIU62091.1 MAG: hypothetical protein COS85_19450 [Armatimonadetes bacterium CG07_land_8_20_14_0_80_59_28]PIX43715.1 MAG: hypothetical protein COZ56_06535 [Armatimonadetes bacterium CG_4_8_14_3_um_filter_58_9]PJB73287.1 MAG: hypothetical protein CO095_06040 [Armatimonadetes bacterium CG_4_9_14_3_um_filter_58_7]